MYYPPSLMQVWLAAGAGLQTCAGGSAFSQTSKHI